MPWFTIATINKCFWQGNMQAILKVFCHPSTGERQNFILQAIWRQTRGQWPYRPVSTRAMRNKLVTLFDFHYFGIHVNVAHNAHLSGIWGQDSLQMDSLAWGVKLDLCQKTIKTLIKQLKGTETDPDTKGSPRTVNYLWFPSSFYQKLWWDMLVSSFSLIILKRKWRHFYFFPFRPNFN